MLLLQSIIILFAVASSVLFPDIACEDDFTWPLFGNNFERHRNPVSAYFSYRPRGEDSEDAGDFLIPARPDNEFYEPAGYRSVVRYEHELPRRGWKSYYRDVMRKHGRRNNMLYKLSLENELSRINNEEEKLEERKRVIKFVIDNIDGVTNFADKRRVSENERPGRNRYPGYLNRNYFTENEEPQNEFGFGNMRLKSVDDEAERVPNDDGNDINPETTDSDEFENERKPKNNDIRTNEFVDDIKPETKSNIDESFNDEEETKNDIDSYVDDNDTPETTSDIDEPFKNKNNDLNDYNVGNPETVPNNRLENDVLLNNERKHKNNDFHIIFSFNRHVKPKLITNDDFVSNEVQPQSTTNENDFFNNEDDSVNNNEEKVKNTKRIEDFFDRNFGVDNEKNDVRSNNDDGDSADNVKSQSETSIDDVPNNYFDSDNEDTKNIIENNMEKRKNEENDDNENSEKSKGNEFFDDDSNENNNNEPKTQPNVFLDEEKPVISNNDFAVTPSNTFLKPRKKIVALHHYPGFFDFLDSLF